MFIGKSIEKDLDRAAASESYQMMAADVKMFGRDKVFRKSDRKEQDQGSVG
jgi:hypothetical protein